MQLKTETSSRFTLSMTPDSRGGDPADGRKVKGATIHWVDAETCVDAEVRLYDNLFLDAQPDGADKDFLACMNPESLTVLTGCKVESALVAEAKKYDEEGDGRAAHTAPCYQTVRVGYCLPGLEGLQGGPPRLQPQRPFKRQLQKVILGN